jgi:hypothetical protein
MNADVAGDPLRTRKLMAMLWIRIRFRIRIQGQIRPYTINICRVYAILYLKRKRVNVVLDYIDTGTRNIQYRYDVSLRS